ncbi:CheW-like domain [Ewingella americana]|uniref:CheW-like domain n=1 Tax=Ewingella americana TaxID=41202 RepID=A0A377NEW2_9GAMM|nr:CheW-like domain [Ewingella americana]
MGKSFRLSISLRVVGCEPKTGLNILLVTEYARSTQAFAVESVDDIVRLEWSQVLAAEAGVKSRNITSIARLDNDKSSNRLALVLDVEQILYDIIPPDRNTKIDADKTKAFALKPGGGSYCCRGLQSGALNAATRPRQHESAERHACHRT